MKLFLFSLTLFMTTSLFAGGFRWPNVEFASAKVFLININLEKPQMFDWHVYEDGVYAGSKLGEGKDLPFEFHGEVQKVFQRGVDELRYGLGKCYMPRHGVIYYDQRGVPVAALTICFECDRIVFWSTKDLPDANEDAHNYERAEKQIAQLQKVFEKYEIPVYNKVDEYQTYLENNKDYESLGEMFLERPDIDSLYKRYSIDDVKSWVKKFRRGSELVETTETKITHGGDKWSYKQLSGKKSRFIFSFDEENPYLVEATIEDRGIQIPTGAMIGMSVDDVIGTLGVYDGIAWPEHIQVKSENLTIDYYFKYRTLVKIKAGWNLFQE